MSTNPHIIGRYTLIAALITALATIGGIYLTYKLSSNKEKCTEKAYWKRKYIDKSNDDLKVFFKGKNIYNGKNGFWHKEDFIIYDENLEKAWLLTNCKNLGDNQKREAKCLDIADMPPIWKWNNQDDIENIKLIVGGIDIFDGKNYSRSDNDLIFYEEKTKKNYLLPDCINLGDNSFRVAKLLGD